MKGRMKINWKLLAATDLSTFENNIAKDESYLNEVASMIALCAPESEFDVASVEPNFLKVFQLAQQLLGFLINDYSRLKQLEQDSKSFEQLSTENKKLRKLLQVHQQVFSYSGVGLSAEHLQCPHCPKSFYDITFLNNHLQRRHPSSGLEAEGPLSLTSRISSYQSLLTGDNKTFEDILKELSLVKEQLHQTDIHLEEEKAARHALEDRVEGEIEERVKEVEAELRQHMRFGNDLFSNPETDSDDKDAGPSEKERHWNIEKIMMIHTQEVQKLGSNIQMLANKLSDNNCASPVPQAVSEPRTESTLKVGRAKQGATQEIPKPSREPEPPKQETPEATSSEESDEDMDEDDVREYVEQKLEELGVATDLKGISQKTYVTAMKRIQSATSDEVAKAFVAEMIHKKALSRASKAQKSKRVQRSEHFSKQENVPEEKIAILPKQNLTVVREPQLNRQSPAASPQKPAPGAVPVTKIEHKPKKEVPKKKVTVVEADVNPVHRSPQKLKSALSKKAGIYGDKKNTKQSDALDVSKRRISFNEERIEISPEETQSEAEEATPVTFQVKRDEPREVKMSSEPVKSQAPPTPTPRPRTAAPRVQDSDDENDDEINAILASSARPVTSDSGNRVEELTRLIEHKLEQRPVPTIGAPSKISAPKENPKHYTLPSATLYVDSDSDESIHV